MKIIYFIFLILFCFISQCKKNQNATNAKESKKLSEEELKKKPAIYANEEYGYKTMNPYKANNKVRVQFLLAEGKKNWPLQKAILKIKEGQDKKEICQGLIEELKVQYEKKNLKKIEKIVYLLYKLRNIENKELFIELLKDTNMNCKTKSSIFTMFVYNKLGKTREITDRAIIELNDDISGCGSAVSQYCAFHKIKRCLPAMKKRLKLIEQLFKKDPKRYRSSLKILKNKISRLENN